MRRVHAAQGIILISAFLFALSRFLLFLLFSSLCFARAAASPFSSLSQQPDRRTSLVSLLHAVPDKVCARVYAYMCVFVRSGMHVCARLRVTILGDLLTAGARRPPCQCGCLRPSARRPFCRRRRRDRARIRASSGR